MSSFLRPEGSKSSEKRAAVCASSVMNLWSSSTAKRCRGGGASPSNPQDPLADTLDSRPVHVEFVAELQRVNGLIYAKLALVDAGYARLLKCV